VARPADKEARRLPCTGTHPPGRGVPRSLPHARSA
jgi:hypothetical protein